MTSGLCSCWGVTLILLDNYLSVRKESPAQPGLCLKKARWCVISGWVLTAAYCPVFFLLIAPSTVTDTTLNSRAFTNSSLAFAVFVLVVSVIATVLMILTFVTIKKKTDALFREGSHAQNVQRQRNLKIRSRVVRLFTIAAVGFIISWGPAAIASCPGFMCSTVVRKQLWHH